MKKALIMLFLILLSGFSLSGEEEYDLDINVDLPLNPPSAEQETPFSIYGYLVNFSSINFYTHSGIPESADLGNTLYMRLKGDFKPEESLAFHFEASYSGTTGNLNPSAVYADYGLVPAEAEQGQFPYEDFIQNFSIDHLWGSAALGSLDLQFGKIPLAWGTGYVFNPTARACSTAFFNSVSEETPGTLGMAPALRLVPGLALQTYLAFQDKNHSPTASLTDGDFNNLPFGVKLQAAAGLFDVSAGFIKEVININGSRLRQGYLTGDFAGAVWDLGVYGEASLRLPGSDSSLSLDFDGYRFFDMLEISVGFDYTLPGVDVVCRGEYYHQGPGESSKEYYDNTKLLSGELTMQGRDYVFLYMEKQYFDYLTISAGGLLNLNDLSGVFFPNAAYEFKSDFVVSLGGYFFTGGGNTEFGGEYGPLAVDLTEPAVYLRMKLSF